MCVSERGEDSKDVGAMHRSRELNRGGVIMTTWTLQAAARKKRLGGEVTIDVKRAFRQRAPTNVRVCT